ncbi:MAG TPA: Gfo/Idh/MocA family oxidoreductase [Ktedonobacteraceae bacterium]|nr:Gfo/Idh/MocA family oxidoreductase [Ktedonobacteraceae bacterium]
MSKRDCSPLRLGIIGAGHIVKQVHLPLLSQMPAINVEGLFDPDQERCRELKQHYGHLRICQSLEELLDLHCDAVLVACPNYLHAPMSIAALQAHAHVLCEKPMATTARDALEMIQAAKQANKNLMIAFTNRFRSEILALKQAITLDTLGEITAIRCGWLREQGVPGLGTWFTQKQYAGGGALTDLGSHLIDLALYLSGYHQPQFAFAVLNTSVDLKDQAGWYAPQRDNNQAITCNVEIGASGLVAFAGSFNLFVDVSWSASVPCDQTYIHIFGRRGSARLETLFGFSPNGKRPQYPLRIWTNGQPEPTLIEGSVDPLQAYRAQWQFFIEGILSGKPFANLLEDNLATVQIIEALYQSATQQIAREAPPVDLSIEHWRPSRT